MHNDTTYVLAVQCAARGGIVAAVSGALASHECYICELQQFDDEASGRLFLRAVFRIESGSVSITNIRATLAELSIALAMDWQVYDASVACRTLVMVSRHDHCLNDLLYRLRKQELNMEITAVVSNHRDLRPMVEREGIQFVHLPVTPDSKQQQEARLLELVRETRTELVVLARYMQILSVELAAQLSARCINIHHSFLPGFKGAKPYHQAYERGVKVIGATAHYVTSDLDEGPIIEQVVTRVDHNATPEQLVRLGRENECMALAKAVQYHIERRVFVHGNKTVVFGGA